MDSPELSQNGDGIEDIDDERLLSLDSSAAIDIFGDPEVSPPVGGQYQADIPPLMTETEYVSYAQNLSDTENETGSPFKFLIGLPLSAAWINREDENLMPKMVELIHDPYYVFSKNAPSESESVGATKISLKNEVSQPKVVLSDARAENRIEARDSLNSVFGHRFHKHRFPGYYLVPGLDNDSWNDIEKASFLLGLYIFEKNFIQVKRFIGHKKLGDILSLYYGKFYSSNEYHRWSDCRKLRSRRCVYGQRIFTGLRQQELMSRLALRVSEECQKALSEVSKMFGEGKMLLEEYVSSLKTMVGINILVDAVGIGKGKRDLTGIVMEPLRSNQTIPTRQEIPSGKACSLLTPKEIIDILTGDYRLSKARANDLFWEAVWPLLQTIGWHSEQPRSLNYAAGCKHAFVFLMPGVKKFSRRLVKGNHYFDSISDVLSKIGSEPRLLEFDAEEDETNRIKAGCEWNNETKSKDDLPPRHRHCYLQPRFPSRNADVMRLTVVDTSLVDGKPFKVREFRNMPSEISKHSTSVKSEGSRECNSEVSGDELDTSDSILLDQETTVCAKPIMAASNRCSYKKKVEISDPKLVSVNSSTITDMLFSNSKNYNLCRNQCSRKKIKYRVRQKLKQVNTKCSGPIVKRRQRLTACSQAKTSRNIIRFPVVQSLEKEMHCCHSSTHESMPSQGCSSQDKLLPGSLSKGCLIYNSEGTSNQHPDTESPEEPQPRALIDLNLPQAPLEFESGVFMKETNEEQHEEANKEPAIPSVLKTSEEARGVERHLGTNLRRQSTRNRPPTSRALEALADGFLSINRKRKSREESLQENLTSRPSQHSRCGVGVTKVSTESRMEVDGGSSDSMLSKFEVHSEESIQNVSGL